MVPGASFMLGLFGGLAACLAAAAWGAAEVRRAGLVIGLGISAGAALRAFVPAQATLFALPFLDGGVALALAPLARKPRGAWPVLLVGLQALLVALDVRRLTQPSLSLHSYGLAAAGVEAVLLGVLLVAAIRTGRPRLGLKS